MLTTSTVVSLLQERHYQSVPGSANDKANMDTGLTRVFFSQSLQQVGPTESKVVKEKVVKILELCQFLVKQVHQQVGGL